MVFSLQQEKVKNKKGMRDGAGKMQFSHVYETLPTFQINLHSLLSLLITRNKLKKEATE